MKLQKATDANVWNEFLRRQAVGQMVTIAHNPCLAPILAKTFGYQEENALIVENGNVIGVLPAVSFGGKLISMPHFSYGGPIFDSSRQGNAPLATLLPDSKFEMRGFLPLSDNYQSHKISCVLNVQPTEEEQLLALKSKLRQKIRKAEKQGYRVEHGGVELLNDYFDLYAKKMLAFGSPPLGKDFFKALLTDYQFGEAVITMVYDGKKVIAAGMCLSYMGFNEVCWSATHEAYEKHNIHALVCWEMAKRSIGLKHAYFSFGRSTVNSNNHNFKKQWNPIELPLYFSFSEPLGKSLREFDFLTKIWKLQPVKTSVFLGKIVSKYLY